MFEVIVVAMMENGLKEFRYESSVPCQMVKESVLRNFEDFKPMKWFNNPSKVEFKCHKIKR